MLLLATLGMLAALPHIATADDQGQNEGAHSQTDHVTDHAADDETDHHQAHNETGPRAFDIQFHIHLTGDQQVNPKVNSTAFGFAKVRLSEDNSTLSFEVVVCNIANVTASHIHVGAAGTNGPVVLPFYSSPPLFNSTDGCDTLAQGTRTSADLIARPAIGINTWNDFINALIVGNAYINVHTTAHPAGEIRGQLVHEQELAETSD